MSYLLVRKETFNFVPTPSVAETKSGLFIPLRSSEKAPAKPPREPSRFSLCVDLTIGLISSTNLLPSEISTPEPLYVVLDKVFTL